MKRLTHHWKKAPTPIRKTLVFVLGFILLMIGIVLIPLPGPGWAIVFVGLAILATEFTLAEKAQSKILKKFEAAAKSVKDRFKK